MKYTDRWERILWVAALLGFLGLKAILVYQNPVTLDVWVFGYATGQVWPTFLLIWAMGPALVGLGWVLGERRSVWLPLAVVPVIVTTLILKVIFQRERPGDLQLDGFVKFAYPSDTVTAGAFLLGIGLYMLWGRHWTRRAAVMAVALVVAMENLSVLWSGRHWATDVLSSWCLAGVFLLPVVALHRRWVD